MGNWLDVTYRRVVLILNIIFSNGQIPRKVVGKPYLALND